MDTKVIGALADVAGSIGHTAAFEFRPGISASLLIRDDAKGADVVLTYIGERAGERPCHVEFGGALVGAPVLGLYEEEFLAWATDALRETNPVAFLHKKAKAERRRRDAILRRW